MVINKYDIIVVDKKIVQYLGKHLDNGMFIQDVHTKTNVSHIDLVKRLATKDEVKWFCENTENINFINPNQKIR